MRSTQNWLINPRGSGSSAAIIIITIHPSKNKKFTAAAAYMF
jgi:hypothetical protein